MCRYFQSILIFLCSLTSLKAQYYYEKGVIVTAKGDTIKGFIRSEKTVKLQNEVYFRQTETSTPERFTPNDLRAFFILPNQYFEAHNVVVKNKTLKRVHQRLFLYQIHEGYARVFRFQSGMNEAYFVRKDKDTTVQSLYASAYLIVNNAYDKHPTDTVTNYESAQLIMSDYYLRTEYIGTLTRLFSDWKDYKPHKFPLTSGDVIAQVKAYNKAVHQDFNPLKLSDEKYSKFILTVGANIFTALKFRGQSSFKEKVVTKKYNSFIPLGIELNVGLQGKGDFKNMGLELGYAQSSTIDIDYKYADSIQTSNLKGRYHYLSLKATSLLSATKMSPYVGFEFSAPLKGFAPFMFFQVGGQYLMSQKQAVRIEFNIVGFNVENPYSHLLKIGYRYRL